MAVDGAGAGPHVAVGEEVDNAFLQAHRPSWAIGPTLGGGYRRKRGDVSWWPGEAGLGVPLPASFSPGGPSAKGRGRSGGKEL